MEGGRLETEFAPAARSKCLARSDRAEQPQRIHSRPASGLKSTCRDYDSVARMGGDEFVMSMPNTPADEATLLVEKMRRELRSLPFEGAAGTFAVTSSFGVAELQADHCDSQALLADADRLLYDAKGSGRDRTLAA